MRAALLFAQGLERDGLMARVASVRAELYGSLGATGRARHRQGRAAGPDGRSARHGDPAAIAGLLASVRSSRQLSLLGRHTVPFIEKEHMMFYRREALAEHPNGMKFHAYDAEGESLRESRYRPWAAVSWSRPARPTARSSPPMTSCRFRSAPAASC